MGEGTSKNSILWECGRAWTRGTRSPIRFQLRPQLSSDPKYTPPSWQQPPL